MVQIPQHSNIVKSKNKRKISNEFSHVLKRIEGWMEGRIVWGDQSVLEKCLEGEQVNHSTSFEVLIRPS